MHRKIGLQQLRKDLKESLKRLINSNSSQYDLILPVLMELIAANVDYSKTDCFELLFKTITCNKFLQIKSVYVFTFCHDLINFEQPMYGTRFSYPKVATLRK